MKIDRTLGIALEAVGISAIVGGIVLEALMRAHVGFIIVTSGAALIAAGSLLWAKVLRK